MLRLFGFSAMLVLGLSAAQISSATDLNAPITDKPTVGSEIARGLSAAETCSDAKDPIYITKCGFDTDDANKQQHSNFRPFELGLFFGVWRHQVILIDVGAEIPDNSVAQRNATDARDEARSMFSLFRKLEGEIGVTDSQMLSAFPFTAEGRRIMQKQMDDWATHRYPGQ